MGRLNDLEKRIETAREQLCEAFCDYIGMECAGWYQRAGEYKALAVQRLHELKEFRKQADKENGR